MKLKFILVLLGIISSLIFYFWSIDNEPIDWEVLQIEESIVDKLLTFHRNNGYFPSSLSEAHIDTDYRVRIFTPIKVQYTLFSDNKDFSLKAKARDFTVTCAPNWDNIDTKTMTAAGLKCSPRFIPTNLSNNNNY